MVTMFTMHLLGAIPNTGKYLELSIEGPDYYLWQEGLFRNAPYRVEAGQVTIPSEPGCGIEAAPTIASASAIESPLPLPQWACALRRRVFEPVHGACDPLRRLQKPRDEAQAAPLGPADRILRDARIGIGDR